MERRKHRRFTLGIPAKMVLSPRNEESTGRLMDLSIAGASLTTGWAVTAGVGVFLTFRAGGYPCEATGSVLRVFPFGKHFGLAVEFGIANDAFRDFLDRLEQEQEAGRPDLLETIEELVVYIA